LFAEILPRDGNLAKNTFDSRLPKDRPRAICSLRLAMLDRILLSRALSVYRVMPR
jgi:hypothetical protein